MIQEVEKVLKKYWGFDSFLPLQKEAMTCAVSKRDSLAVMPTGGGKSLCFQAPAMTVPGLAVVVSPLISLMKDQIDALTECGVPAARLDSSQTATERKRIIARMFEKTLKILYLAPERLLSEGFTELLQKMDLSMIAIDEAHCISMWGHDFRPEYRKLGLLKKSFPGIALHAYTATATEQVRRDIIQQLHLENPKVLIGSFDRPNLVYKMMKKTDVLQQIVAVLERHKNESGIIYCIKRDDVDEMCANLNGMGYSALPYHAGMSDADRKKNQDAFITEEVYIIVATVAFGMGIDKSNVRYVLHAGMPRSLEHYQQESGRAGRDGLEAECCLLYSPGDYAIWKSIVKDMDPEAERIASAKLNSIYNLCTGVMCRHQALLEYFGQKMDSDNCSACDVCLGDLNAMEDSLVVAQKILSCVARLREWFGADYTAMVLVGSKDQRINENKHDSLSTYGLLSDYPKRIVRDWIEQLVGQGCIEKTGEYTVLKITEKGWRVLRSEETPLLLEPPKKRVKEKVARVITDSWEGVDKGLFEVLRTLRREIANKKSIPAYIVFGDAVLRDMARLRPSRQETFLEVKGVGTQKAREYSEVFISIITQYCKDHSLEMDVGIDRNLK